MIALYAQTSDSVVAGNRQYDTSGILLRQAYIVPAHPCPNCTMASFFQSFLQIRDNKIDGEYDWQSNCSASGIATDLATSPQANWPPPTMGFAVSVSHNVIRHADALKGGAIALFRSWFGGPAPHRWPLSDAMLIDHNTIEDIDGPRAAPICATSHPRVGIAFPDQPMVWHTVLYANSCSKVSHDIGGNGVDTVRVCPSPVRDSCECPSGRQARHSTERRTQ